MVNSILEGFMLKVNFRKNHDRLKDQEQTEMGGCVHCHNFTKS